MNDAIIPAVFSGVRVVEGDYSEEGGLLVVGAGRTVLEITLENSRNTEYPLEILGADRDLVETPPEFDGRSLIRLALECPENGDERILDITLHLGQPPGRAQPADYRLPLKYALERIQFFHIIPDALSGPVTKLVLVLDKEIPGLSPDSISVAEDGGAPFRPDSLVWVSDGICEIGIKKITPAKSIAVEIAPAGYRRESLSVDVNANPAPGEIQFLYAGAHDSNGTTEKLTLVFNQDVPGGLLPSDVAITRQGGGSPQVTVDGNPVRKTAGIYELAVIVTESGTVDVAVAKGGYSIVPGSLPVEVRYVVPVKFVSVTADGSDIADTTKLTLKFDRDIAGLAEGGITLNAGSTEAVKGSLTPMGNGTYDLSLTGIKAAGTVRVTVRKDGYHFEPESITEGVHYVISVEFKDVMADGLATTSWLTLEFDKDIAGLAKSDITLDEGSPGAGIKELYKTAGAEGKYTLELADIKAAGEVKVTVHKDGYHIVPEFLPVNVHYVVPAVFRSVTASGTITNGKLVPYPSKAVAGDVVKVYLHPNDTYVYKEGSLKLEGNTGGTPVEFDPQSDGTFTFDMPNADVKLTAQFFQPEAKLVVGGDVQYFETLKEAFTEAGTGAAVITVLKDVTVSEEIAMEEGTVTLVAADGPIKTVKRESSFTDSLFTVEAGASLTLGAGNSLGLALDGDGNNITASAPLVAVSGGTLTMNDRVTLKNNNNSGNIGGVYVSSGTFKMTGGVISGNTANSDSGGVRVNDGTFNMTGGMISDNTAKTNGGGVLIKNGTFTMEGGTISGNTANGNGDVGRGGGVYVHSGTFNMKSGVISGNTANNSNQSGMGGGGGVFVNSDSTSFTMEGGTISGNTVSGSNADGNGVYVNSTFTMKGNAAVKQEVYLAATKYINVSGKLEPPGGVSAEIKLADNANNGDAVLEGASGYSLTESDIAKFTLNDTNAILFPDLPHSKVRYAKPSGTPSATAPVLYIGSDGFPSYGTFTDAINAATGTADTPAIVYIASDVTLGNTTTISNQHIKLTVMDGGTKTLERANNNSGSLFTINTGASLVLDAGNGNLTLDGNGVVANASLVTVSGGALTMGNGVTLTNSNNNSDTNGGGVLLNNGGTFTMTGGSISDNISKNDAGGVSNFGGTFKMTGGTISNNKAKGNGSGGVAGGVFLNLGGTFTMTGGTISNNEAWGNAGGVLLNSGNDTFTMEGGTISGNSTTTGNGGGVYLNDGTFTMTGGTISSNIATDGGGVYQNGGTFTMSGGKIDGNNYASFGTAYCKNGGTSPPGLDTTDDTIINGATQ